MLLNDSKTKLDLLKTVFLHLITFLSINTKPLFIKPANKHKELGDIINTRLLTILLKCFPKSLVPPKNKFVFLQFFIPLYILK